MGIFEKPEVGEMSKVNVFFKWQHRACGVSFERYGHANFKYAYLILLR